MGKADRENKKATMSYEELAKSIEKAREANQVENFNLNKENNGNYKTH